MKILIFSHEFPPYSGGAGTYALELANGLKKIKHDVSLLIGEREKNSISLKNIHGININVFPFKNRFWFLYWHYYLKRILIKQNFDLIILANFTSIISASKLDFKSIFPNYIITIHGVDIDYFFGDKRNLKHHLMFSRKKIHDLFNNATYIVSVSDYLKEKFQKYYSKSNIYTVHHGIDYDNLPAIEKEMKKEKINILCVSRVAADKGHDKLIASMEIIIQKYKNVNLTIVGDGNERIKLENYVKSNNLGEFIKFTGNIPREKLPEYYSRADIFAMVSRRVDETFGIVYIEAMAFGLPIIASDFAAIPEVVQDNLTGFLVDPNSENQISARIISLIESEFKRKLFGENGLKAVKDKFNNKIMAKKTVELI